MTTSKKSTGRKAGGGFTAEERAAMRERVEEGSGGGEAAMLEKIAAMAEPDRRLAERVHAIVMANGPGLAPRTWYGMPAWARDGQVVCFFQGAGKFKTRYATLGFSDKAKLDEGAMWATAFALTEMTGEVERRIGELVRRAVG